MKFNKVAVLCGGKSSEREISLISGATVLDALKAQNINAEIFDPSKRDIFALKTQGFDCVFNVLHGGLGENGELQACLKTMNISYTGSDTRACVLSDDKYLSKLVWREHKLPVADYVLISGIEMLSECERLGFPLFIKPTQEGSSIGVYKVENVQELLQAYEILSPKYSGIMAEAFLSHGEFSCPILGEEALPVVKIEPSNEFYDYEAKYLKDDNVYRCPAGLSSEEEYYVRTMCLDAFRVLGCKGWARVDFMAGQDGRFYLLEVNTAPGMTAHSLVPKSAQEYGLHFEQLCLRILNNVGQ